MYLLLASKDQNYWIEIDRFVTLLDAQHSMFLNKQTFDKDWQFKIELKKKTELPNNSMKGMVH